MKKKLTLFERIFKDKNVRYMATPMTEDTFFDGFGATTIANPASSEQRDKRIEFDKDAIKQELSCPPPEIKTGNLALSILKTKGIVASLKRKGLETSAYNKALVQLEARKSYDKVREQVEAIPTTTRAKIDALATKYKLTFNRLGGITRDLPFEAAQAIDKFCSLIEKATKLKFEGSEFWLIAPPDWWQKKRDPILLVESPFGNYFYIICAWDKEVDIVGELLED